MKHTLTIDESQRQMLLMALAHLAVERPGWCWAASEIAAKVDNRRDDRPEMFEEFRTLHGGGPPDYTLDPAPAEAAGDDAAPRPSTFDLQEIEAIVGGKHHHFSAHLMRLVKKADFEQRERLRRVYPHHVAAVERWEAAPYAPGRPCPKPEEA